MQSETKHSTGAAVIESSNTTGRRISLPFSEMELLQGLDAAGAHAEELAQLSEKEVAD